MATGKIITINLSAVRAELKRQAVTLSDGNALTVAARAIENKLKKHFAANNQKPNKMGYTKTNLWADIRNATHSRRDGSGAIIEVNHPAMNLKVYGGKIVPKRGKAIAIPINPAAYGRSPRTFPADSLFMLKSKGGNPILARKVDPQSKVLEAMYLLLTSTYVPPDPHALPPEAEIQDAGVEAAMKYWRKILRP
jgi:hypothetical protein